MQKSKNNKEKKAMLKSMVKGSKGGNSPFRVNKALGKKPLSASHIGGGNGENLGTNGIF